MEASLTPNERQIVGALQRRGPLRRSAIAKETGIPPSTVRYVVKGLIKRKVVAGSSPRGSVRLLEPRAQAERRGKPKARGPRDSHLGTFWESAKTDPAGTIAGLEVSKYVIGTVISIAATAVGWPLVALVAGRVATGQLGATQAPAGPSRAAAPPPPASNGHSAPPAAPAGLRVVKAPAHLDPKHQCGLPFPRFGWPQIGQVWICNQDYPDLGISCGRMYTWTGVGWCEWQHPAGFKAREKYEAAWLSASRDVYVQPGRTATILRSPLAVQNELQLRIEAYAARRPEPGALRTLRAMALRNPARADELLKRNGY